MVTVVNKDNSNWEMLYNHSIVLLDMASKLSFEVYSQKFNYRSRFDFCFLDSGEQNSFEVTLNNEGDIVTINLHQWETERHIENAEPLKLRTGEKRIWIKWRTLGSEKKNFRKFDFTIWIEI